MKLLRRQFLHLTALAAALAALPWIARAQTYPTRPITMIVPFAAGGPADAVARIMAERMRQSLGQPIIVENVCGAEGSIATGRAVRAPPDGYSIGLGFDGTHALNAAFFSLPYDVFNDFAPISPLAAALVILFARKTMPAKDLNGLIAWLKANPNRASAGTNNLSFRALTMLFQKQTGTQFTIVPYRAAGPAYGDIVAGRIDLAFATPFGLSLMRDGSIKAYAVTGNTRLALAPDIPTFAEMGLPEVSYSGWLGFFAPKGTSKDIINKLNAATVEALADATVRSRLSDLGQEIFPREQQTPEALGALQNAAAEKWWPLIKEFGIKAE
jgi:tripartite-type tricarboxylate transporter receptor subunit TctC